MSKDEFKNVVMPRYNRKGEDNDKESNNPD